MRMVIKMYGGYAIMKKEYYYTLYVTSVYKGNVKWSLDYTHAKMYKSAKRAHEIDDNITIGAYK